MARRFSLVILSTTLLLARGSLRGQEVIVPAGTILQCTLQEANLSSKTAAPGDPILCDTGSLREFGVSVFPRGAYLEGRFADAREPGHLWGKGWMQLEFDHILLPGSELPISTRVTSVPHLNVDLDGRVHGKGHARRDIVEWAIPVLWPEKVLTLPMRGPRPALKQEARISVKLMQSLSVPQGVAGNEAYPPLVRPGAFRPAPVSKGANLDLARQEIAAPRTGQPRTSADPLSQRVSLVSTTQGQDRATSEGTLLILKDGSAQLAKDYWFESGQTIQFLAAGGKTGVFPIEALDLGTTVKLNRERGVAFVIRSQSVGGEKIGTN
jgi:hypothetical protein